MASRSRFQRVHQWLQFCRQWHVIDADRQDARELGIKVATYLCGKHKPFWHPETDCGDHVVVVNTSRVAMHGFDWKHLYYYFSKDYPKSKNDLMAYEIHDFDPCRVVWMAASRSLKDLYHNSVPRRRCLERLHLLPSDEMPSFIRGNLSNQLSGVQHVPKRSVEYTAEERASFPRLVNFPQECLEEWTAPQEKMVAWEPRQRAKEIFNRPDEREDKEDEIC